MCRFWNLTTVCLTLAALCTCLAVALVAIEAYGAEPGLVQQVYPRQVQAPSPPPRAEDLPVTVKRDYKGPQTLVIVAGKPEVITLANGKFGPMPLVKLAELDAESREIAEAAGGTDGTVLRTGHILHVGISDGNKFAKPGEVLATYTWKSSCPDNSQFTPDDDAALTFRAQERINQALVAWTISRHTVAFAEKRAIYQRPGNVDVQLNLRPVAVLNPQRQRLPFER